MAYIGNATVRLKLPKRLTASEKHGVLRFLSKRGMAQTGSLCQQYPTNLLIVIPQRSHQGSVSWAINQRPGEHGSSISVLPSPPGTYSVCVYRELGTCCTHWVSTALIHANPFIRAYKQQYAYLSSMYIFCLRYMTSRSCNALLPVQLYYPSNKLGTLG